MTEQKPRVRLVLVDDHQLFRAGVRAELASTFDIVGEASSGSDAVALIVATEPDVVLLDVHMNDGGGLAVLHAFHPRQAPGFLALSVSDDATDVVPMIRAGARGYVTKSIATAELVEAIHHVHRGDAYFSPRLAALVLHAFASPASAQQPDSPLQQLTPREREVLHHLARGYPYKQIAARLGISPRTVEAHVSNVLGKLQLTTRHELSHWATTQGLLDEST